MRSDMKNDQYEVSNRYELCFCLNKNVVPERPENFCMRLPCKILLVHFENKYGREKKHGKTIITDKYIKYITTCRFLHNQYYLQIGYIVD